MLPEFDVILPCYNPNDRWYHELLKFHQSNAGIFRLNYIIVDDGSATGNLNAQLNFLTEQKVPFVFITYPKNKGKGFALREGVKRSTAGFVLYTDIDFPFQIESMLAVMKKLAAGNYDIVAGYRDQDYYLNKMSRFRRALSRSFRFFMQRFLKMPISDTQCGLKAFNETGRRKFLGTRINRYLFDFEFIYTAVHDKSVKLTTVPVHLKEDVTFSKMRPWVLVQESLNLISVLIFTKR